VWQSFLGFAIYDVLGKIRISCPALTSLLRQRHFSKRNNVAEQHIGHAAVDCRPKGARPGGSAQAKKEAEHGVTHARGWLGDYANRTYASPHSRSRLT
jgi:hypothetical protein